MVQATNQIQVGILTPQPLLIVNLSEPRNSKTTPLDESWRTLARSHVDKQPMQTEASVQKSIKQNPFPRKQHLCMESVANALAGAVQIARPQHKSFRDAYLAD